MSERVSIPRLRSVRFKSGGQVRVLPSPRAEASRVLRGAVEEAVDRLWRDMPDMVAGFALVVWAADGTVGANLKYENTSPYVATVLPQMTAEAVRRVMNVMLIKRTVGVCDDEEGA